jgi:hypothetical protein
MTDRAHRSATAEVGEHDLKLIGWGLEQFRGTR